MTQRVVDDAQGVREAAATIRRGGLVAFPTETVYGLGADAGDDLAVARIFEAKRRPRFNPLIVHLASADAVGRLARWTAPACALAEAFWPGPLTLVLERLDGAPLSHLVSAGGASVALRVPAHPTARRLLETCERPVAAPSANPSGCISPTRPEHVVRSLGPAVDLILDGGACPVGIESTVVDARGEPALLRPGGLAREEIEAVLGRPLASPAGDAGATVSPGTLASHYAPELPLRLDARWVEADEALLAFGSHVPDGARAVRNLSMSGDLLEAAANLFAALHDLDQSGASRIAVMPIPRRGLGEAIHDRLRRAAAPRR